MPPLAGNSRAAEEPAPPTLDELRDRMARIVHRWREAPPSKPEAPKTISAPLPFVEEETPWGPLFLARKRLPIMTRVGFAPVDIGRTADAAVLALFGLNGDLSQCRPAHALYLDTETTGLGGGTGTLAFLVGLAFFEGENVVVEQLLLRRPGEERPVLEHLAKRMSEASMLVTFNGKSFDMPLLRSRAIMNRMGPLIERPHLDLLHVGRRLHGHRLRSATLRAIEEEVLGHVRIGDIHGAEVAACYGHFLRSGDEASIMAVVEHNMTDVVSMVALVGLYGEPLTQLGTCDWGAAARAMQRGGDLERALSFAERFVAVAEEDEVLATAVRVRGDIARARGDKARALLDYEKADEIASDPALRLTLAKLYEHHARDYRKALEKLAEGTTEPAASDEKRRKRVARKLEVASQRAIVPARAEKKLSAKRSS